MGFLSDRLLQRAIRIGTERTADSKYINIPWTDVRCQSTGKISFDGDLLNVFFSSNEEHSIELLLPYAFSGNGVGGIFFLNGWSTIESISVGYIFQGKIREVIFKNLTTGIWLDLVVGHHDIAFGLQNSWHRYALSPIQNVQIAIKGTLPASGVSLLIKDITCWNENSNGPPWASFPSESPEVAHDIQAMLFSWVEQRYGGDASTKKALRYLNTGDCSVFGPKNLSWKFDSLVPDDCLINSSHGYSWNALHPALYLLLYYTSKKGEQGETALFAARDFIVSWINTWHEQRNFGKQMWYDHAVAERQIVFLLMWCVGIERKFDYRFMNRLSNAIYRHAQLLANESFVPWCRPVRYHNHAVFQSIALCLTGHFMTSFPCSLYWTKLALDRLYEQVENLFVEEHGCLILIENTIGYHNGFKPLLAFIAQLASHSDCANVAKFDELLEKATKFSSIVSYSENFYPAFGDQKRNVRKHIATQVSHFEKYCTIFEKSGYAVVRAPHDRTQWILCLIASSLTDTHKHQDNLSFTLFFDGIEWLIDTSFFSYEMSMPIAKYLRSPAAHNCIFIEGEKYILSSGCAVVSGSSTDSEFIIDGSHTAYEGLNLRRVIKGNMELLEFSIIDSIFGVTKHQPHIRFQCAENVIPTIEENKVILTNISSTYAIEITFPPYATIKLYKGEFQNDKPVGGISGLGFMEYGAIYTIDCLVEYGIPFISGVKAIKKCCI